MTAYPARLSPSDPNDTRQVRAYRAVVVVTVLAAVVLRFAALERYPLPLHQDELSNIYDGYSIATTGADRSGARWPVLVRGMGPGDYRPSLYAYLAAVTTGIWGFSTWAGRMPAAITGSLTVLIVFLLARRLLGRGGGLLALLFATFSPILIQYGRQAHEGASLPAFFAILTVYLLYRSVPRSGGGGRACRSRNGRQLGLEFSWICAAGLVAGLSTNAYGAQRLTGPLFVMLGGSLIAWHIGWRQRTPGRAAAAFALFSSVACVGALPQLCAMIYHPVEFFARADNVAYSLHHGLKWWIETIATAFMDHFDARMLFFSVGEYEHLTVSRLSLAALPFLYLGIAFGLHRALVRRETVYVILLAGVAICILPAAASRGYPSIIRASGVWALYPVICALGVVGLGAVVRGCCPALARSVRPRFANAVVAGLIATLGVYNVCQYVVHPQWHDAAGQNKLVRIGEWLRVHGQGYERIYIDSPGHFPSLYIAAFTGMHPREFQRAGRESVITATGWERFRRFGKFRFDGLARAQADWNASSRDECWLYVNADGETISFSPQGVTRDCCELAMGSGKPTVRHP